MDPFARRKLGTTNVMLPQLGFGGAPVGNLFSAVSDADATATLETAWSAGVRYYDTSPYYGRTLSEHRLGTVLRSKPRDEVILSTKVGRVFFPPADPKEFAARERNWPQGLHFEYRHDYTYDAIMRTYEDSLQRLGMNRIDMLLVHDLDIPGLAEEAKVDQGFVELTSGGGMRALEELKAGGVIRAIGAGVNRVGTIPRFLDAVDLDFFLVASPYTLMDQPVLDDEFPRCQERGVGFVIGQVYASGILATGPIKGAKYQYRDATPEELARAGAIETVCKKHGVAIAAAALQFPLHHPLVASVIPGAFTPDQVTRNVATMQVKVPDQLWADLKREGLLREDAPTP
jgi:D-threo-aldose 1-dehydrogenase